MKTLDKRLEAAWAALNTAAQKSDRDFWTAFDDVEARTLEGLGEQEKIQAAQALHAYLAKLKGSCPPMR